jgi:hypothetical protein
MKFLGLMSFLSQCDVTTDTLGRRDVREYAIHNNQRMRLSLLIAVQPQLYEKASPRAQV